MTSNGALLVSPYSPCLLTISRIMIMTRGRICFPPSQLLTAVVPQGSYSIAPSVQVLAILSPPTPQSIQAGMMASPSEEEVSITPSLPVIQSCIDCTGSQYIQSRRGNDSRVDGGRPFNLHPFLSASRTYPNEGMPCCFLARPLLGKSRLLKVNTFMV